MAVVVYRVTEEDARTAVGLLWPRKRETRNQEGQGDMLA